MTQLLTLHKSALVYIVAWYQVGEKYRQLCNISRSLADNKLADHSDVVGASPIGAAPTTSSFAT